MPTPTKKRKQAQRSRRYKAHKDSAARHMRAVSLSGRDISDGYPAAGNADRRESCRASFRLFCETYFKTAFPLPWSKDHPGVIEILRDCATSGGLFSLAMPRGSGKTQLCEKLCIWALLYGYRRFVCLVGPTGEHAERMLGRIKSVLIFNDLLAEDFRHVCYPIRRLENDAKRCVGQIFEGRQTAIGWKADILTLPSMPAKAIDGVDVSGATMSVVGLTGNIRGQIHILRDGSSVRPELVILDDPQTRESAMSPSQSAERAAIVAGDVLGMAGPGKKIAAVMPCTVIREGDMADRMLDRKQNPQWQGVRTKLIYSFPANEKLWTKYAELRQKSMEAGLKLTLATEFYREHRAEMDEGADVAWPERFEHDELSAVQYAMNLKLANEAMFWAEYQNDPASADTGDVALLPAEGVMRKLNGLARSAIPTDATHLTAFIDVQDAMLFYCVAAWHTDFTGWVVDYGAWPDQKRRMFALRKPARTLQQATPGAGREGAIRAGLEALTKQLLGREWKKEDGSPARIDLCMVDAGWEPGVVFDFCRHSTYAATLTASRGAGVGAANKPLSEYTIKPGERRGWFWNRMRDQGTRGYYVRFDTNHWKSFLQSRLAAAHGDRASLSLYGNDHEEHRLIAEHITAEAPVRVAALGRTVDQWKVKPSAGDNHWLDCVVGCAVAASVRGCSLEGVGVTKIKKRRSYAERYAEWKARREAG